MSEGAVETLIIHCDIEGDIHVMPEQVYDFPNGIVGFELLTKFALLPYEDTQLYTLRAFNNDLGLLLIPAAITEPHLEFEIDEQTVAKLELTSAEDVTVLYIVRIIEEEVFVNQKAPILLSLTSKKGCQFIIQNDAISLRVPLALKGD